MSEINCYGTEEVFGRFLGENIPGTLVRLVNLRNGVYIVNGNDMKEGSWGITFCNDPSFVFDLDPLRDFPDGEDPPEGAVYWETLIHYDNRLVGPAEDCYRLVHACIQARHVLENGGFAAWLMDKMREYLDRIEWKPVEVYQ